MTGAKNSYPALPGGQITLGKMLVAALRQGAAAAMSAAMLKGDVEAVLAALRPLSLLGHARSGVRETIGEEWVGSYWRPHSAREPGWLFVPGGS
jgi:hypothetical protein